MMPANAHTSKKFTRMFFEKSEVTSAEKKKNSQREFQSFLSTSPQPPLPINDRRLTEFYSKRERRVPPIVFQKFDSDPMNYWLFVRQFEAHVLGKVEDYELFPSLYQNCESHVQAKMNHLSNQPPVTRF